MFQCLEFGPCSCYFDNTYFSNVYDAKIYAYRKTHTFISSKYNYGEGHCYDVIKLNNCIITYYHKNVNINLIQNWWRKFYKKRIKSADIIKKAIREAIANPNTQLCKNRLLHEFHNM